MNLINSGKDFRRREGKGNYRVYSKLRTLFGPMSKGCASQSKQMQFVPTKNSRV